MKNKSLYELGKMAQSGDDMAMLEIIERKRKCLKGIVLEMKIAINLSF